MACRAHGGWSRASNPRQGDATLLRWLREEENDEVEGEMAPRHWAL
jgi:hypothetical protein